MCTFNREGLPRDHVVVEQPSAFFGNSEGRLSSTEHPQIPGEARERAGHGSRAPQLLRQRARLLQAATPLVLTHAEAPRAARQDDAAGAEPRLFDLFVFERVAEVA